MSEDSQISQDETSLADGFNSVANPALTETPGQEQRDEGEQAAEVVQEAIEYAQITKAEYDELRARAAMIDEIKATQDKSFGTFGRTIKGLQDRLAEFNAAPALEIPQEEIDAIRNEGFDLHANVLEKLSKLRSISVAGGLDDMVRDEILKQAREDVSYAVHTEMLEGDHEDWQEVVNKPEWSAWAAKQPPAIQEKLKTSWNSRFLSKQISSFKDSLKPAGPDPAATTRKSRFEAAVTPRGSGQPIAEANDEAAGFNSVRRR